MRAIDADRLKEHIDKLPALPDGNFAGNHSALKKLINMQPTVEPERKPGKWEYVQYDGNPKIGNWHCSNCRLIVNLGFEGAPYYHYCPGCGAKMEVDG